MSEKPISPLRRRMIEDMTVRNFVEKTRNDYICQSALDWDPRSASKGGSDSFLMKFAGRLWFSNGESAPCGRAFKSHR